MTNQDMDRHIKHETSASMSKQLLRRIWPADVLMHGGTIIPNILLSGQAELGLSTGELTVLLNLVSHWWADDGVPPPSKETIGSRMGKDARTIQRYFTALENKGFIQRVYRFNGQHQQESNAFDLSSFIAKLEDLAWRTDEDTISVQR